MSSKDRKNGDEYGKSSKNKECDDITDDRKLFEYFIANGHLPGARSQGIQSEETKNKIKEKLNKIGKKNAEDFSVSDEDKELFLIEINRLNLENHPKHDTTSASKDKRGRKPNPAFANPKDKIDLHGLTKDRAYHTLKDFVSGCIKYKKSPIIVVHGKGIHNHSGKSALKEIVEYYIATEGREFVEYSFEAAAKFGGSGAKILYLKIETT